MSVKKHQIRSRKLIMILNQALTYISPHLHWTPSTLHTAFSAACHNGSLVIVHVPFLLPPVLSATTVPSAEDPHVTSLQTCLNLQGQAPNGISSRRSSWILQLAARTTSFQSDNWMDPKGKWEPSLLCLSWMDG